MDISVFNSLTKKKDNFTTKEKGLIKWYTCGPTVYDVAHLGHARTFLTFDIIRRILEDYFNYEIIYIMNITDIDDKIIEKLNKMPDINKANYQDKFQTLTRYFEKDFFVDMKALNIKEPTVVCRVSEYIDKIIKYIQELQNQQFAYESNGSVYFDIVEYTKRGYNIEPLKKIPTGDDAGDAPNSSNHFKDEKKNPEDFVL